MTFDDLIAPMTPATFFAEYHDRQPLHIKGGAAKFAQVLSWRHINRLLDMTHMWSSHSLKMYEDGIAVPPERYCVSAVSRDAQQVMQPVAARVAEFVKQGCSVVLNDVDSLTPGMQAVSDALEGAGLGKAQANVYISWQSHKAFPAHYDTHEVWAVQVEGEKYWNIWEGRAEWPIPHPVFRAHDQAHHESAKGRLREKVLLKTGDLLYLPRGWYHDALAEAPSSVHIAYGTHAVLGMDLMNILLERVLYEASFRQALPRQDGTAPAKFALTQKVGQLGQRLAELCKDPKVLSVLEGYIANHRYNRGHNDLLAWRGLAAPSTDTADEAGGFRVLAPGAKPVRRGADWVLKTEAGALPLSPPEAEAAAWLLGRPDVTPTELARAHPAIDAPALLARLAAAGLLLAA